MCHYYSPRVGPESRRYTRDANTDEASTCRRGELMAQYINYVFFKLDLMWHRLPEEERGQGKRKFCEPSRNTRRPCSCAPSRLWA